MIKFLKKLLVKKDKHPEDVEEAKKKIGKEDGINPPKKEEK